MTDTQIQVAAFGAMRRAVAIARCHAETAKRIDATVTDPDKERWDLREGNLYSLDGQLFQVVGASIGEAEHAAGAIRSAIRAAMRPDHA
jgi:hypothetical protein